MSVILVWIDQRAGVSISLRSSKSTGKPRPPITTAAMIGASTAGSVANPERLSE